MGPNLSPIKYIYFEFRNYQNHQSLIVKKGDFKDVTCQEGQSLLFSTSLKKLGQ